ncbi:MAG: dihydroorotase [Chitinophagaceae bacterium]|nr:dihydroorotase [Chitinophagaceae bacterium]
MKVTIKKARIIDPSSPHHLLVKDIAISDGTVSAIEDELDPGEGTVMSEPGLHVSPGWIDIFSNFNDPGHEYKETLESGARAAAAGGFTDVMVLPNTKPVIDVKSIVEYVVQRSHSLPVSIIPIGAVTRNAEGRELAEMYDMRNSGALAFSDGLYPVQSAGILVKALQYVKAFDGVIIQVPDDRSIAPQGLINEGIISTRLGLPGKPSMAEELVVARDIKLARYTDSRLHFTGVSSPKSLEYIKRAKESGIRVTCSVTPYHLFFCDEDLLDYDTNLKVNPPLRTKSDMMALRRAVAEDVIDCIATHHLPHEYDSKVLEFEYAKNGMIGLESAYAVLKTVLPELSEDKWVKLLSLNAAAIFGLSKPKLATGQVASLTLFNPDTRFMFTEKHLRSKSRNSPFLNKEMQGKVKGIINKGSVVLNENN